MISGVWISAPVAADSRGRKDACFELINAARPLCCREWRGVGVKAIRGLFLGHSPREKRHSFNTRGRRSAPTRNRASAKTLRSYTEETETQNLEERAGTV